MLTTRVRDVGRILANVLSLCWPQDRDRVTNYMNRSIERLLYLAKWKGTTEHYQVCLNNECVTWPRELETIEAVHICGLPSTPRNHYYPFMANGPGMGKLLCTGRQLIDEPEACAFDDVKGTGKELAVYCDRQEDPGTTITVQYFDKNGQFVTTIVGGQVIDGEQIALPPAGTYAYSNSEVMPNGLLRVFKDQTKGTVRLFEYDTATTLLRPLAIYQRDELTPIYRRSRIPGLKGGCCTSITNSDCKTSSVVVIGKIRFIPVFDDDDFLCISYPEAVRLAGQAVLNEENGKMNNAAELWSMAIACLQQQLKHWQGDGAVSPITLAPGQLPDIQNLI